MEFCVTINAFIPLIFGLLCLVAGLYVVVKAGKSFLCGSYFFASIVMSCYFFMYFVISHYHNTIDNEMFILKIFVTGAAFIVPALLSILLALKLKKNGLLRVFILLSVLFAFSSFYYWDRSFLLKTSLFTGKNVINVNIFSYYLFFLNVALFLPLGIVITAIKKRGLKYSGIALKQSRFIILSVSFINICFLTNFAINFGMSFNFIGSLLMLLSFISIAYAIVKFRCLSFDRMIYKILLLFLFVAPLLFLHIIISKLFLNSFGLLFASTFSLIIIIFVVLFFPYKEIIRKFLNRNIYRGKYDYQNVLADLSQGLTVIIEFDQLCDYLIDVIVQTIDAKNIALFQEDIDNGDYIIKSSTGIDSDICKHTIIQKNCLLVQNLQQNSAILIKSELNQNIAKHSLDALFEPVSAVNGEIILPLRLKDRLIGIIVLSDKSTEEIYNQGDIDVLKIFASEASKALEHARVYSQAITDNVSKVFNQNYFLMRLREEIARSKRFLRPISLLFISLEDLQIDDQDIEAERLLLQAIGLLLKTKVRNIDIIARYGNKMFAVILPETVLNKDQMEDKLKKHKQDTMLVANRISNGIKNFSGEYKGKTVGLDSNIGISCFDGENKQFTEENFVSQADTALSLAKKSKKNKIVCFEREK